MKKLKAYKYSITPEVTSQYEALGRIGAKALNEINQFMLTAKNIKSTEEHYIYTHTKSGLTMYLQRKYNVIDKILLNASDGEISPLFNGQYKITDHSEMRALERFGKEREDAEHYFNQLLKTSVWISAMGKRHLYEHKSGARIAIDVENLEIITVYKNEEKSNSKSKITVIRIAEAIQREFKLMKTQLTREVRRLTEQHAELSVRAAEMALNKARCKAPHTQQLIQSRIEEVTVHINHLALEIDAKLTEIKRAEDEVKQVLGG